MDSLYQEGTECLKCELFEFDENLDFNTEDFIVVLLKKLIKLFIEVKCQAINLKSPQIICKEFDAFGSSHLFLCKVIHPSFSC